VAAKEAIARIKMGELLQATGWRFFEEDGKPASVCLDLHQYGIEALQ
jgi:hypothetical protein